MRSGGKATPTERDAFGAPITRFVASHALALIAEWGALIGLLVYAYDRHGAGAVGIASMASLSPYVLTAAITARAARRWPAARVRAAAITGQALGYGLAAATVALDQVLWLAIVGTGFGFMSSTALRPANAVLLPAIVRSSRQLTAANVRVGYGDASATFVGPLTATLLLGIGGPAATLTGCAVLSLVALGIAAPDMAGGPPPTVSPRTKRDQRRLLSAIGDPFADIVAVARRRGARGVLMVAVAQYGLVGASDVIWVVIAAERLDLGSAGAGILSALFGAGSFACSLLLGRAARRPRLAPLMLVSLGLITAACLGLAASITVTVAAVLIPVLGLNRGLLDLLSRVLLQRSAPPSQLASVFGALETVSGVGLLSGSLLAQGLLVWLGPAGALAGIGATCAITIALVFRWLRLADAEADVPVVEMSLLAQHPVFAPLPVVSLEAVARQARELHTEPGAVVITEGEPGDCFYAVADGAYEVSNRDGVLRTATRGDGFGEIALLAGVPRTASVRAVGRGSLLAIDRDPFLLAVTGHEPSHDAAWTLVQEMEPRHQRPPA